MGREIEAWEWVDGQLHQYSELLKHQVSYEAYRSACLVSYEQGLKKEQLDCEKIDLSKE
jgi:hypothetical protein